jgi:hypothetical protein
MLTKKLFKALIVTVFSLTATGGCAMGVTDIGQVCLFSGMTGTITMDGKPVANARLIRMADRDGPKEDETITDEQGRFAFPPMFERTITKFLPMQFSALQRIHVEYKEQRYEIWRSVKMSKEENSESRGNPIVVTCDLNSEEKGIVVDGTVIHTLCEWDIEPDAPVDWTQP